MIVNKKFGKIVGATLTKAEEKALIIETRKILHKQEMEYCNDRDALVLYVLHQREGWGKKKLRGFYDDYKKVLAELTAYYEMPDEDVYLARRKLKEIGVDIEEWNKEVGSERK